MWFWGWKRGILGGSLHKSRYGLGFVRFGRAFPAPLDTSRPSSPRRPAAQDFDPILGTILPSWAGMHDRDVPPNY